MVEFVFRFVMEWDFFKEYVGPTIGVFFIICFSILMLWIALADGGTKK